MLGPEKEEERVRQQLTGQQRDRMIAEGQEQHTRYLCVRHPEDTSASEGKEKKASADLLQTLRFFDSLGKPLSTWERQVLAEADKKEER